MSGAYDGGVLTLHIPGEIIPWARHQGGRSVMPFTPKPQRDYMTTVKSLAAELMVGRPLLDGPLELSIVSVWAWPASISPKKRLQRGAELKTTRPDSGNVAKLIEDAFNKIVWTDDARVCDTHTYKRYGDKPGQTIQVRELNLVEPTRLEAPGELPLFAQGVVA